MEILASKLRPGHSLPNGAWGSYTLTEVTMKDGWVVATGSQGKGGREHTFWLQADQTAWLA